MLLVPAAALTTTQLAQRTGVPAGTLRMWESRYAFPAGTRQEGGRRNGERDVDAVGQVLRLREQGLSTSAAIARALAAEFERPASIFAGLRASRPELQPTLLTKRSLLSVTHAIEDEYCARAGGGLIMASFQEARFYRRSQRRWRELTRTAAASCVLADFDSTEQPANGPAEVAIAAHHALAREWTLVIDAPDIHACLAAWEPPADRALPDRERRFEVLWSFEPEVVQEAASIAIAIVDTFAPVIATRLSPTRDTVAPSPPELRVAASLAQRMVGYLAEAA
jgi:DICT domain-containing protein